MLFTQIKKNEHRTRWLMCIFFTLIILFCNFIGILWNMWLNIHSKSVSTSTLSGLIMQSINLQSILKVTIISIIIVGLYMFIVLHKSMTIIMDMNHAQEITSQQQYPILWKAVSDMAIAAGLPMPKIFIINDSSPNAFSTGNNPKNSAIGVTTGLLSIMNAQELEGVIGHEMSHIQDHDTRVETIGIALTSIFAFIGGWFFIFINSVGWLDDSDDTSSDDYDINNIDFGNDINDSDDDFGPYNDGTNVTDSDANTDDYFSTNDILDDNLNTNNNISSNNDASGGLGILVLFGVAIMAVSWICCGISYLTQLALSRNREYLADAGSVNLTRNPKELINALQLLENRSSMTEANPSSNALYIVNPHKPKHKWSIANLFDTHPPLDKRIQRLEQMAYAPK